jgi:hypothetical protein
MNGIKQVKIILSEEDAKRWIEYQKNYNTFVLMLERGVFDIKNGSALLNFDNQGILQNIQRSDYLYSRKHEM